MGVRIMFNIESILKQYPGAKVFEDGFEVGEAKYSSGLCREQWRCKTAAAKKQKQKTI